MLLSKKTKKEIVRFMGKFPRGNWEIGYYECGADLLGFPLMYCPDGYDVAFFDIQCFPYSEIPVERGIIDPKHLQKTEFLHCLVDWEGILDQDAPMKEDGSFPPLPCTRENKEFVFDFLPTVRSFVLDCIDELAEQKGRAIKNLSASQSGRETRTR